MREIFAVDVHTQTSESNDIVERALSDELIKEQENYTAQMQEYEKRARTSPVVSVIKAGSAMISIFLFAVFFGNLGQLESLSQAKANVWLLLGFAVVFGVTALITWLYGKNKVKKVAKDEGYLALIKRGERIYEDCVKALKVPSSAKQCDIFLYVYTTKSGAPKPVTKVFDYVNTPIRLFSEDNKVMIADLQTVFSIEKSAFIGWEKMEKRVSFNTWNKPQSTMDKEYLPYSIKVNAGGIFTVKNCVKVILEKAGEKFCIVIPPYDAETFLKICGLSKKDEINEKSKNNGSKKG